MQYSGSDGTQVSMSDRKAKVRMHDLSRRIFPLVNYLPTLEVVRTFKVQFMEL